MIEETQVSLALRRERLRYGFGAACIGIAALLLLLSFRGGAAQGLAAPLAPNITKNSVTSLVETNNAVNQAVAGELVTVTVTYNVPSGETIYDASLRVLLADGLLPTDSDPAWLTMITGTLTTLRGTEALAARQGALVVFPTQGTVTGPATLTGVVYAVRTQYQYAGSTEIAHGTALRVQAVLRYCADSPGCATPLPINNDNTDAQVIAIRPEISATCTETYLDSAGLGAGGGQVRLNFPGYPADRPSAYTVVFTATVGVGLTDVTANGGTVSAGPGGTTYVVWTYPNLPAGVAWQPVVTVSLPAPTFTIGFQSSCQGATTYETFAGDVPYEGKYSASAAKPLYPGLSLTSKTSIPSSGAVTMGDRITYTLAFTQAANTVLQYPYYFDTLSRGFHYVSGTLTYQGATLLSYEILEGPSVGTGSAARYFENLRLNMDTLPASDTARQITFSYVALNTGLDYRGTPVWDSSTDMTSARNTIEAGTNNTTGALLYWIPPLGFTYGNLGGSYDSLTTKANSTRVDVTQPFLVNAQFLTYRDGTAPVKTGDNVLLSIRMRNSGAAPGTPAHELEVCDTIPQGFAYMNTFSCTPSMGAPACPAYTTPAVGSTGKICWMLYGLPRTSSTSQYHELKYQVEVLPTAMPGVYSNTVFIENYSTKAGTVEGERNYQDFAAVAIPKPVNCGAQCITVAGLAGDKQPWVPNVAPGDLITYTLWLTDTRGTTAYTGAVVTDTYDMLLSYVSADPPFASHNPGARQIIWDLGALSVGGSKQMTLTMRVASEVAGRFTLTNTMSWDSDQSEPFTIAKTTAIDVSALHLRMDGPMFTHAGGSVVYTLTYSNTGSWNNAPVTLTLDYGPYLTFVSSSPLAPVVGTQNRVFVDTVPNNGANKTLTINLSTNMPLPYMLEKIISAAALASPGAPPRTAEWTTTLQRPVFQFRKIGPAAAPPVNGTILYTFELANTGNYTATGLLITDTWDTATSFQTSSGWTLGGGTYATYTLASLAPGASATVNSLAVRVGVSQDSYLNRAELGSAQTSGQTTTVRTWSPSIELAKTAYPDPVFPGRVLTYTLVYTNVGDLTIANAVITDTLSDGFTYQNGWHTTNGLGCQSPGWQFSIVGQIATWKCTTLDINASGQLQIWGLVDAGVLEGTWLENMAESDGAAPVPYRPMDQSLRTLVARPWLRVNKAGVPTHPVAPGDRVTYTLSYENYGSYLAHDVVVKDQLPTQLTFAGCDPACVHNAGLVSWTIGELPVDGAGEVTVYATINAGTGGQTAVNSNYTIENTTIWQKLLPSETQQGAAVNTTILNPQLTLTKVAAPTVVQDVNDTIVYTITYANTGGGLLNNVVITDVLDIHTAFTSASAGCVHTGAAAGGTVTCQLGDLLNGESRHIVISVRVLPGLAAGDTVQNQVQGRTDEAPLTTSNTTTVWYRVSGFPEIVWTPANFTKSAVEGSTTALQDTLTVSNTGTANLLWSLEVTPTMATWLRVSVSGGDPGTSILPQVTAPGESMPVTISFDPTGLTAGTYNAWLRILSNDSDEATVLVPVTFTIQAVEKDYYIYLPLVLRSA